MFEIGKTLADYRTGPDADKPALVWLELFVFHHYYCPQQPSQSAQPSTATNSSLTRAASLHCTSLQ